MKDYWFHIVINDKSIGDYEPIEHDEHLYYSVNAPNEDEALQLINQIPNIVFNEIVKINI